MGDQTHLEKMGRELKCPICLSLLSSAVSLTCNHAFCNSCILKSMKSGSNCPVCKVPYRRRGMGTIEFDEIECHCLPKNFATEVRPAPHMDNLVSIYKSMEVASGINIFVTQNAPSTKLSDREKQSEGDDNHGEQDTGGICQDRAEKQRTLKGKAPRKTFKTNMKNTSSISVKPSFPTKKRVQVPQCSLSENPTSPLKFEGDLSEIAKDGSKMNSNILKEKPVLCGKGEQVLSPFFWLRDEEDAENLSQPTDGDQFTDTPPPNVPSFSDIKDSDDEYRSKLTPTGEVHGKSSSIGNFFDSEMFEWTQRPSSPELCSSPFKMQVVDMEEVNEIQEKESETALQGAKTNEELYIKNAKCMTSTQGNGIADVVQSNMSSPRSKSSNDQIESNKSKKRGRKASKRAQKKCSKRHTDSVFGIYVDSNKVSENFIQEQRCDDTDSSLNLDKTIKRSKKTPTGISATKPTAENVLSVFEGAETRNNGDKQMVTETPPSLSKKESSSKDLTLKKAGKRSKRINCLVRSEKGKLNSVNDNMVEEIFKIPNRTHLDTIPPKLSLLSFPMADNNKASDSRQKPKKFAREFKSCNQELRSTKKLKISTDGISKDEMVDDIQEGHTYVPAKETQPHAKIQYNPDVKVMDDSSAVEKTPLMNKVVLRKCETIPNKFQCAFCLSSEESEASGEMVHYYNGRPIAADHNGGSKVIHSHRNCTEWAPNVYFEDDVAINLEAELTRSRRIKCCCCGTKGAALGCYEKSCRKSFHVACAKSIPQCRWDTDNFVMLCPIHASSELPNESSGSQERRERCNPKGKSSPLDKVASKHEISTGRNWKSCGSLKKLVLCCSALTTPDRETVTEFERLSGVTVLKKWDLSVTHVIASTDENGACRRTLKILMGILEGKWILNMEWIKASMKVMELVDEDPYEITVDVHGIKDGPRLGRLRLLNKQPKLFEGFKFYFMGDFIPSYKGYLQELVIAAGGTILHRKPIPEDQNALSSGPSTCQTFIIYSLELPDKCDPSKKNIIFNCRRFDAKALASSTGAKVASNTWVLNSIAACKLQNLAE